MYRYSVLVVLLISSLFFITGCEKEENFNINEKEISVKVQNFLNPSFISENNPYIIENIKGRNLPNFELLVEEFQKIPNYQSIANRLYNKYGVPIWDKNIEVTTDDGKGGYLIPITKVDLDHVTSIFVVIPKRNNKFSFYLEKRKRIEKELLKPNSNYRNLKSVVGFIIQFDKSLFNTRDDGLYDWLAEVDLNVSHNVMPRACYIVRFTGCSPIAIRNNETMTRSCPPGFVYTIYDQTVCDNDGVEGGNDCMMCGDGGNPYSGGGGGGSGGTGNDISIDEDYGTESKFLPGTPRSQLMIDIGKKVDFLSRRRTDYEEAYQFYKDLQPNLPSFSYNELYQIHSSTVDLANEILYNTLKSSVTKVIDNISPFIEFALWESGIITSIRIINALNKVSAIRNSSQVVWSYISNKGVNYSGTNLPKYFTMSTNNGNRYYITTNATEHMKELAAFKGNITASEPLRTQLVLTDFRNSIKSIISSNQTINYGTIYNSGRWEIIFAAPRTSSELPAIIHALPR